MAKNARAKIARVKKNYGIDLNNQISVPSINEFQTRQQYNEWKEGIKDFTNVANLDYQYVKNEAGMVITKRQHHQLTVKTRTAQRYYEREIEKLAKEDYYSGGEPAIGGMHQKLYMMGRPKVGSFGQISDFSFDKITSLDQLKYREQMVARRADPEYYKGRMEKMQENWIKKMRETFGVDSDEIVEKVEDLSPEDFYQLYLTHEEFDFDYHYINDLEEMGIITTSQETGSELAELLSLYIDRFKGYNNNDLNGF